LGYLLLLKSRESAPHERFRAQRMGKDCPICTRNIAPVDGPLPQPLKLFAICRSAELMNDRLTSKIQNLGDVFGGHPWLLGSIARHSVSVGVLKVPPGGKLSLRNNSRSSLAVKQVPMMEQCSAFGRFRIFVLRPLLLSLSRPVGRREAVTDTAPWLVVIPLSEADGPGIG
jgi:hypothetical protein